MVSGTDLPLWGMEIDPERAKADFRASAAAGGGKASCSMSEASRYKSAVNDGQHVRGQQDCALPPL